MTKTRVFTAAIVVAATLAVSGCNAIQPDVRAAHAVRVAAKAVSVSVPDARLVSVATPGATDLIEPASWSVVFISPSAGRAVLVAVVKGKAGEPEVLTRTSVVFPKGEPATPQDISVDSDRALRIAEEALAKTGVKRPKYVLMNLEFALIDGAVGAPGEWVVGFLEAPGGIPVKTVGVDSKTGKTRVIR